MKNDDLFKAIGDVKEEYLIESENYSAGKSRKEDVVNPIDKAFETSKDETKQFNKTSKAVTKQSKNISETALKKIITKNGKLVYFLGAAAVICLIVLSVKLIPLISSSPEILKDTEWPEKIIETKGTEETTSAETAIIPHWNEQSITQQFSWFMFKEREYTTRCTTIEGVKLNEQPIGECSLEGYDIYEDKKYTTTAKIYEIKGINEECAVAIQFNGDSAYYVYVYSWYLPETLGDFINDLSLRNNLTTGLVYYYKYPDKKIVFENFDTAAVWEYLFDDISLTTLKEDIWIYKYISVSVSVPVLGYENITITLTEDGYMMTNILNTEKCYYIGTEKVAVFEEYILENCDGYSLVYEYTDIIEENNKDNKDSENLQTVEVFTVPAYNPKEPATTAVEERTTTHKINSETVSHGHISETDASVTTSSYNPAEITEPSGTDYIVGETTAVQDNVVEFQTVTGYTSSAYQNEILEKDTTSEPVTIPE